TYPTLTLSEFTNDSSGTVMDTQNDNQDNITLGTVRLTNDITWALDADLANKLGDNVSGTVGVADEDEGLLANAGGLIINSIKLLSDSNTKYTAAKVADANLKDIVSLQSGATLSQIAGLDGTYTISSYATDDNGGYVVLNRTDIRNLITATAFETTTPRTYDLSTDENIKADIEQLGYGYESRTTIGTMTGTNATLTINGNNNAVVGSYDNNGTTARTSGITVQASRILNINDVGSATVSYDADNNPTGVTVDKAWSGFTYALAVSNKGRVNIDSSVFANNTSRAIFQSTLQQTRVDITDSIFYNNSSTAEGGAIYTNRNNTLNIDNTIFQHNHTTNVGGAIDADFDAKLNITNSSFIGNSARDGGALYLYSYANGSYNIKNSRFISNTATTTGSAIMLTQSSILNLEDSYCENNTGCSASIYTNLYIGTRSQLNLKGTNTFKDNTASIYNKGTVNFTANSVTNSYNNITGSAGILNMAAGSVLNQGNLITANTLNMTNATVNLISYLKAGTSTPTYGRMTLNGLTTDATTGSLINAQNGAIQANTLGAVTLGSDLNLKIDAKLDGTTQTADNFSATSIADGDTIFNISDVKVIADSVYKHTRAQVASSSNLNDRMDLASDYTQTTSDAGKVYNISYDAGYLLFNNTGINTLVSAVRDCDATYTMTGDENIVNGINTYNSYNNNTTDIGTMSSSTSLEVTGEGYDIVGGNKGGLTVGDGSTLTLNNVADVGGFNGAFITNYGTVEL
ncbi:MAG: hypothetical protein IJH17_00280, partial [Clostridia bacterium]|nr:hypothetical protein [Clostridia bacterium]